MTTLRTVQDSMGAIKIPAKALYGAQTGRALSNFKLSDLIMPQAFIHSIVLIKQSCARANTELGLLPETIGHAIQKAAFDLLDNQHNDAFPLDVFQTGSGTSTNMNVNEVIATLASRLLEQPVHPNDHVNLGQSSNDVIPSTIHLSASLGVENELLPALSELISIIAKKEQEIGAIITTGRTHLMDAVPISYSQILSGWGGQLQDNKDRIQASQPRLQQLALGGTAVGTGLNSHPMLAERTCFHLSEHTGILFSPMQNKMVGISSQDTAVELSGQLKTLAVTLMKISNDLRWLASGPLSGLNEIMLEPLQPGSSIMPGKVNPVIPEAVAMAMAQVMGNDATISLAGQFGNFQLNTMLPVISYNLLQSIHLLATSCSHLGEKAIAGFTVNSEQIKARLEQNPILATALNPVVGYERVSTIVKTAYKEKRAILDVACEMTDIPREELKKLLNPEHLTAPHNVKKD